MRLRTIAFFFFVFSGIESAFSQAEVTLEEVIALALEKNYDVRIAKNASESASTDDHYVVGGFLPRITGEAGTVWNRNEQQLRFQDASRNNSGEAQSNNLSGSVQAVWTLF